MTEEDAMNGRVEVSVVLPAYNEADRLEPAVDKISQALRDYGDSFEIIIAEDGSTDGTDKKAGALAEKLPFVRHIHGEKRLGRGIALKNAFKKSRGGVLVYMDVDLATDIGHLKQLISSIKDEGYDLATGSRMLRESKVHRTRTRGTASKTYNFMVRLILRSKVTDHQCGFKAFRREPLMQLLDEAEATHWFWDTEILVRAARKGCRIKEVPVEWKSGSDTKVRLFRDSWTMFRQIISLWFKLQKEKNRF